MGRKHEAPKTFESLLARFVVRCRQRELAAATVRMYEYYVRSHLVPAFGNRAPGSLHHSDLEVLYAEMSRAGFAISSVRKCHVTASAALKYAEREGWISNSAARLAEPPKKRRSRLEIPSPSTVAQFLAFTAQIDQDIHDYARVLAATGARPGEVCALRHEWLQGRVLTIQGAVELAGGRVRVKETKTGSVRRVTLDDATVELIIRREVGPFVFDGPKPWRPDVAAHRFRQRIVQAGVEPFTARSLRHFHATQLLASGRLSVRQVADRLGHSSPVVTLTVYAQSIPALDAVAADVIAETLSA